MNGRVFSWFMLSATAGLQLLDLGVILTRAEILVAPLQSVAGPLALALGGSVLLGTGAALVVWRLLGRNLSVLLTPYPLLIIPVTLGVPMLWGHVAIGVAVGATCALWGLQAIEPAVLRAAACSGMAPLPAYLKVVLCPIVPQMTAGALLSALAVMCMLAVPLIRSIPSSGILLQLTLVVAFALVLLRRPGR